MGRWEGEAPAEPRRDCRTGGLWDRGTGGHWDRGTLGQLQIENCKLQIGEGRFSVFCTTASCRAIRQQTKTLANGPKDGEVTPRLWSTQVSTLTNLQFAVFSICNGISWSGIHTRLRFVLVLSSPCPPVPLSPCPPVPPSLRPAIHILRLGGSLARLALPTPLLPVSPTSIRLLARSVSVC